MSHYLDLDYKKLYDTSLCGYVCSSPNGIIIEANNRFLGFTGYDRDEVIEKKSFTDFLTAGGKMYFETHYSPILRINGAINEINFELVEKGGAKFSVLINSMEVRDEKGHHLFTQSAVFKISHRKEYEKELLLAKRKADDLYKEVINTNKKLQSSTKLIMQQKLQLEELNDNLKNKNQQLSNFAHIASHNLRSPVSNLNSLLQFYNASTDLEDRAILFTKFETVISHLTETLNELIESLKIQEDLNVEQAVITFDSVFSKTKAILDGQIMKSKAVVTADFSKANKIEYPKLYLESIMLNLFSNSIKYRSPHRIPEIRFQTENINNEIILTISDNGLGIDLEKHGHKFFGLNNTFHEHPEAKGVGLFMTKIQIEAMGGSIEVASEIDKGTTFKIILKKNVDFN
jgi:PAS domain S-box-containing protein